MSSYQPLADYLARRKADSWDAEFEEVERILGRPLPQSAYRHNAWWANQTGAGHSQTHGWRSVGWKTARLDVEHRKVRFERESDIAPVAISAIDEALVQQASELSGIVDRNELLNAALREFIKREGIRGLIEMGGSQPGFQAGPRKRPWA